jgi:hypothetical protein
LATRKERGEEGKCLRTIIGPRSWLNACVCAWKGGWRCHFDGMEWWQGVWLMEFIRDAKRITDQ